MMKLQRLSLLFAVAVAALLFSMPLRALDLTKGLMWAVPTPGGKAPDIDGDLKDWDLSAAEPIWITAETAQQIQAHVALMYDADALYIGARISLPGRPIRNPNNPTDAFWWGDVLEFRLASDPSLPAPLDPRDPAIKASNRIVHLSLFKNSQTDKDYLHIAYGVDLDKGKTVNPPGSRIVITQGRNEYVIEARVPWSALNVPGRKNPFAPGQKMTAVWGVHWGGETQTAALYRANPGAFAFMQAQTWGQVAFSRTGHLPPQHATLEATLAAARVERARHVGVPITVTVPAPINSNNKLKISINIFGPHGEVLRELMAGEERPQGKTTVYWDGHDQWGAPVTPGHYRWGAYLSNGLKARYMGGVGKSGNPPYNTEDERGGWGADHGPCIDTAADETGLYFLWTGAEDGRAIVKTDYAGNVLWRKTPFVGGGFGPHDAVAANGKTVFLTFGDSKPQLLRLDAHTGQLLVWGDGSALTPISDTDTVKIPENRSPIGIQPETSGLACNAKEVFASVYSRQVVRVLDAQTGKLLRELACPHPRGVCLDGHGSLYVVSDSAGKADISSPSASVYRFQNAQGEAQPVIVAGLQAPWAVAVDADGHLYITDLAESQQVKVFTSDGKPLATWGKAGGRPWTGTYDGSSFLHPAGIAADSRGGILVAETTLPKVMSRFDAHTGQLLQRWFGSIGYAGMDFPDPQDPWTVYYPLEPDNGFARAHIPKPEGVGEPSAYWQMDKAGFADVGTMVDNIAAPIVLIGDNKQKYVVCDGNPHGICLVEGDRMLPVGHARIYQENWKNTRIELWSDLNGDHHLQPSEVTMVTTVEGKPLVNLDDSTGSMWMNRNGDLYFVTQANRILKIPAAAMEPNGAIRWDASRATYVVPQVLDRAGDSMFSSQRHGMAGLRVDSNGNLYTCFSANVPYATPELTKAMTEGLGHTGECNAVKFAKYAPDGHLLWMAGRKATAAAGPGEMYHFWVMGGLVGDRYIAGCSEWGQIYFYTNDGFFVDALMNNPGLAPPAGPYTFGSETFGGRVQDYPALGQVWAYSCGYAYQIQGFVGGRIAGEQRQSGSVTLDRVYATDIALEKVAPLQIMPLANASAPDAWQNVPASTLRRNSGELGIARLGYDANSLYVRIHVADETPLRNGADTVNLAFKGGDAVGLDLGHGGPHAQPVPGDVRLLAAMIGGQPRLIAMKPFTRLSKRPEIYFTPAGGTQRFEFVGEVPGGNVTLTPDRDGKGYTALMAVPRSFLEVSLTPGGSLSGDVEILLSGQGARGLQTTSRNYLFTPRRSETTMVDDIPTEARLYPQYWGQILVK
jgi:hypothetical protein